MSNIHRVVYRTAQRHDGGVIARLHTLSWQRHYRGIYEDDYLDNQVAEERKQVWNDRFDAFDKDMYLIKAMVKNETIGFACTFLHHDAQYGALVDNLHVLLPYQGKGIGRNLLKRSAEWVATHDSASPIYLYVLDKNQAAKLFYQNLGAELSETEPYKNPAGGIDDIIRCSWNTSDLIGTVATQDSTNYR